MQDEADQSYVLHSVVNLKSHDGQQYCFFGLKVQLMNSKPSDSHLSKNDLRFGLRGESEIPGPASELFPILSSTDSRQNKNSEERRPGDGERPTQTRTRCEQSFYLCRSFSLTTAFNASN